ncbi:hypothetical protein B0H19DRAFT_1365269 [Mycena capillaripes]|nr:hypothetical protein B0H19DRAFT_1365269 [Mycena capillaripes]
MGAAALALSEQAYLMHTSAPPAVRPAHFCSKPAPPPSTKSASITGSVASCGINLHTYLTSRRLVLRHACDRPRYTARTRTRCAHARGCGHPRDANVSSPAPGGLRVPANANVAATRPRDAEANVQYLRGALPIPRRFERKYPAAAGFVPVLIRRLSVRDFCRLPSGRNSY